jgi:O-acetyl-ADP-ribose deacetylase (regulator of RNase III)
MTIIEVVLGDITDQDVDAIVTAANESLLGGGGVDGAIHRAAGPRLAEAGAAIGPCDPGDAMATPAFALDPPVRHIIHTVGPVWEGGGYGEAEVLASCYRRSLEVADELGARSVAFPAIATGVYGFPPEQAAKIAVHAIRSTATAVGQIRLVAFDPATRDLLESALGRVVVLRASNGLVMRSPEEPVLNGAVNSLTSDGHVILEYEGESDSEDHYIQVWLRPDGDLQLEYRAGCPEEHYQTIAANRLAVRAALVGWMRREDEWKEGFEWRSIGDWFR